MHALRVAVPVGIVTMIVAHGFAAWLNTLRMLDEPPEVTAQLGLSGTKITMVLPRLTGFTHDARPYEMRARTADRDMARPEAVELRGISARVGMEDNSTVEMSAPDGLYNTRADTVTLGDDTLLKSSKGYEAHLSNAVLDMRSGHMASDRPADVRLVNGTLVARSFEEIDSGALIRFNGGVEMVRGARGPLDGIHHGASGR